jgi:hypothetical protein
MRVTVLKPSEMDHINQPIQCLLLKGGRKASDFKTENDILPYRPPGKEGILLPNHGSCREIVMSTFNSDPALSGLAEAGDQPDQGRLSTAARTDEHKEFPILDLKVNLLESRDLLMGTGIVIDHGKVFNVNRHR